MPRALRIWLIALGTPLLALATLLWWLFRASQDVPEFYREAIAAPPPDQAQASDDLVRGALALVSQARKSGEWSATFTEEQVNGWMAVDLVENHAQSLPPGFRDPRISITPDGVSLACQVDMGAMSTVCSLDADVTLDQENVVALRIRHARAGALPVPLEGILEKIDHAAMKLPVGVRWVKVDGDPVALITIPPPEGEKDTLIWIDAIELRLGEVHLAGRTMPRAEYPIHGETFQDPREAAAAQAADRSKTQR
jgi:hypothetical protein